MSTTTTAATSEGTVQVLVFGIGDQQYCIELEYITEIMDSGKMTPIPNTPDHVEGVIDLRGRTTTIINPLVVLENKDIDPSDLVTDGGEISNRILMFDSELLDVKGAVGWLVSSVSEVTEIPVETLEAEGVTDAPMIRGVVKQDTNEGFLIWLDPQKFDI